MKLQITSYAWEKILCFTDLCPAEISGLGKVQLINGNFVVIDVAIFQQEVSGAHSDIEAKALAQFQSDMVKKGESMKDWVLWWHSHADMGVFFSSTDTNTIDNSTEFQFLVSLVVNKKHEREARLDLYRPFRMTQKLDIEVLQTANEQIKKVCEREIAKKVTRPAPKPSGYTLPDKKNYPVPSYTWRRDGDEKLQYKGPYEDSDMVGRGHARPELIPFDETDKKAMTQEYTEHRKWILTQIHKMKKAGSKAELREVQRALSEWDSYGRALGLTTKGN